MDVTNERKVRKTVNMSTRAGTTRKILACKVPFGDKFWINPNGKQWTMGANCVGYDEDSGKLRVLKPQQEVYIQHTHSQTRQQSTTPTPYQNTTIPAVEE